MNSKDYKDAINQIHASEKLKEETKEKIKERNNKRNLVFIRRALAVCAVIAIIFTVGLVAVKMYKKDTEKQPQIASATETNDLPRFQSMDELKEAVKNSNNKKSSLILEETNTDDIKTAEGNDSASQNSETPSYSETNIQVENVDEADIVKTDGKYIYYLNTGKRNIYIINPTDLTEISKISLLNKDITNFSGREMYVKNNKIIVLGNENAPTIETIKELETNDVAYMGKSYAKALIFDISDIKSPKKEREIKIDGYYETSRMIDNNLYFISEKNLYYNTKYTDEDYLPTVSDSLKTEDKKTIKYNDIAYFRDTESCSYMIVAGLDVSKNEDVSVETFFGANGNVYANESNLYISQTSYKDNKPTSTIYKFNLYGAKVNLQCKGEVEGSTNNQFSLDEYKGNLRVATTSKTSLNEDTNQIYILNENLEQIGRLGGLTRGERIYSVRFVERIAYVVTFKETDPLLVIDLSDPTNPTLEGKLKIPGYSTYLHPYDEDHIIGIGYDDAGVGATSIRTMKMSMFDVSDLTNPKEMFKVRIGNSYASSEVIYNHKALFYNIEKNLIGFPVDESMGQGFAIYKIDLEKGFEKYAEVYENDRFLDTERIIYIGNTLYAISTEKITSYNLDNMEKISELKL